VSYVLTDTVKPGSTAWWLFVGIMGFGRVMDLLSTWVASPTLALEGNPFARRLGWRGGVIFNAVMTLSVACLPVVAVGASAMSLLVAARNFQSAWLMRSLGEWRYRMWMAERVAEAPRWLMWCCHLAEGGLFGVVGLALISFSTQPGQWVAFGVGVGVVGYSTVVVVFTSWSLWRGR
jgi:hypothetical protein